MHQIEGLRRQLEKCCQGQGDQIAYIQTLFSRVDQLANVPQEELLQLKEILWKANRAMQDQEQRKNKYHQTDLDSFRERQARQGHHSIPLLHRITTSATHQIDPLDLNTDLLALTNGQLCGMA